MAQEQKHAALICAIMTVIALLGIAAGIYFKRPIAIVAAMLPAVAYEVYRTEGFATKAASIGMLAVLLLEGVLILGGININLAGLTGRAVITIRTFRVPLGDLRVIGPVAIGILSYILIRRTAGKYTIWLAWVILISSVALLYSLNDSFFRALPGGGVIEKGIHRVLKQ